MRGLCSLLFLVAYLSYLVCGFKSKVCVQVKVWEVSTVYAVL